MVIQEQHFTKLSNGEVWVDKQSDVQFWDRYLKVFDEIIVCARMVESDDLSVKALRSDRKGVSFVGLPNFRGAAGIVKHYLAIQKALKKGLKEADCIIFRAPSPISMVSYGIVRRSGKPFAVELMNNPYTHFSSKSMHHVYQPVIQAFITNQTKRMCRTANGVAYVTEHVLQDLCPSTARVKGGNTKKYFESSYSTINIGKTNFIKKDWGTNIPDPIILVHSGEMLDYRKGQNVFIEALAILRNKGYSVRGILIGDGEIRPEFEQLAIKLGVAQEVEFVGWKSGFQNVQNELLRGHFFVFPSTGEGLPRSVIEAMASGLICIGSKIDGITELLSDELLVEEFLGVAFADKIETFIKNWESALMHREILFKRAEKYENVRLEKRRTKFYEKLRECKE